MIYTSVQPVLQEWLVTELVATLGAPPSTPLLLTPTIHLFTAISGAITPQSDVTQFTEATFAGYASPLASFAGPVSFANSAGLAVESDLVFAAGPSIAGPGETVLGYWVDNGGLPRRVLPGRQQAFQLAKPLGRLVPGPTNLYCAELFPTPFTFSIPYDYLSLTVRIGLAFASEEGIPMDIWEILMWGPVHFGEYSI